MEVVMGTFPTCWDLEAMDGRNAEDGADDENGDMYFRYVCACCCDSLLIRGSGRTCNKDTGSEGDTLEG